MIVLADSIADEAHLKDEAALVRGEVGRQLEWMARDQAQISWWDESVISLGKVVDPDFVEEWIAYWLWYDFDIEASIVVSASGEPAATVFRDEVLEPAEGAGYVAVASDLVTSAQQAYLARRRATPKGYYIADNALDPRDPLYAADVRMVEGRMHYVIAQAVIPDEDIRLPEGTPPVLLTFKPVDTAAIGAALDLAGFDVIPGDTAPQGMGIAAVGRGETPVHAVWTLDPPSAKIIAQSMVPVLALLVLATGVMGFVAWRYGAAIRELQTSEEQNRFLALHDALTGLANRLQFDRALEQTIARGEQGRCAILCVDLDRFKAVNDTLGHHAGDVVIKTVADRIAGLVGEAGIAARIGGDEFIILLRDELDKDSVLMRCDTMIEQICQPVFVDGAVADVGASIGVAWWPDDALTAKAVIRSADEALYVAKRNGRGRVCLAGSTVDEASAQPRENAA